MKRALLVISIVFLAGLMSSGTAQSIYVDYDVGIGDPAIGNGAPSSAFGGAAGVPGFWNRVFQDQGPFSLMDTAGSATTVVMNWSGGGGTFGYRNTSNTGDYALWLNDGESIGGVLTITLTGLAPGQYRVFTAAVQPQGGIDDTYVTVLGSATGNPQLVTGPMSGNQLIQGITHCVHDITVSSGSIEILAEGDNNACVNGFQLVAVPEPITLSSFAFALVALVATKRRAT